MNPSHNRKKVLVIAYFFPPLGGGGVQRTVKFVKYLRDFGYEPTIVTVKKGKHSVADTSFDADIPKDIRIIRTNFVGLFAPKKKEGTSTSKEQKGVAKKSFLKKILASVFHFVEKFFFVPDIQMLWRPFAYRKILSVLRKEHFDVLYSTSSPFTSHLIGRDVHRATGISWVADFRDHWTLAPAYVPASPVHAWFDAHFEKSILREASGVIFNTETNQKNIQDTLRVQPKHSTFICNGFDPDDFGNSSYQPSKEIRAYYIGSLYGKQYSAREIIPALDLAIEKIQHLHVTFIGDIDSYSRENIAASKFFNKNIFLKDYVPHSEITKFTQEAAFLLAILPNIPRVECWVPQKIYEYIGSGRPTFALAPEHGEVAKILQKVNGGTVVHPGKSPQEISDALVHFVHGLQQANFSSQTNKEAAKAFERKNETKQLAAFFDEVLR